MIEKFERLEEPKQHKESVESILFSIIFFFFVIMAAIWYYQKTVIDKPSYARENEIKLLEEKQNMLEEEINKVRKENTVLRKKINANTATILPH